eukprot:6105156-Lingulodinium_polyedra.AAC.1
MGSRPHALQHCRPTQILAVYAGGPRAGHRTETSNKQAPCATGIKCTGDVRAVLLEAWWPIHQRAVAKDSTSSCRSVGTQDQ